MKKTMKIYALLLSLSLLVSLCGCSLTKEQVMELVAPTEKEEQGIVETVTPTEAAQLITEKVVRYQELSGNFNPLTAAADGDKAVVLATSKTLDELGRGTVTGMETEDGSYTVTVELPGGLRYSDGETLDIDDVIFSLYVLMDESYTGDGALSHLPVLGVEEYYRGIKDAHWEKYSPLFDEIYNGGRYDEELQKKLNETKAAQPHNDWEEQQAQKALDEYDQEKAEDIRQALQQVWREDALWLVDYCMKEFAASAEFHTGYTAEQLREEPGLQVMYAMVERSFASLQEDGTLVGKKTGASWDLRESFPTVDDFYNEMYESYGGNAETYWTIEGIGRGDIVEAAREKAVAKWASGEEDWDGGVVRIPGIVRVGDRMATITFADTAGGYRDIIGSLIPAPRHIFAVEGLYDYANASYGFPKGDVSKLPALTGVAVGLGEHTLASWEEGRAVLVSVDDGEELIIAAAAG